MKIRSERGRETLYIGCVYMPTDRTSVSVMDSCYQRLKEDVLSFREKGKVVLLGDFNASVGRFAQIDDVVGMFGKNTYNVSGNELGKKMIVCGRAARWWDEQMKDKINARRQVDKKVVNGQEDLWGEYCRLQKEVKQLVIEKKLNIWNELVEKVNTDFDENRKEFCAFVGRKSKGKKKNIASLKSDTGLSLTSTRGKLEVLQRHYQLLSKMSVDSVFDADWTEEVEENVKGYSSLSEEVTDSLLDKEIEKGEIAKCLRNLKNSKTGGSDGIVGELLKYGGSGMVDLLEQLFSGIWREEIVRWQWREGLIINIFKKGDREDPAKYRGITLLRVVGKVCRKILNNRLVQCLDKEGVLHEGQAGFRINRSCMDNVYTLNEIVQGRLREDKKTYALFLDIQKAYDSVWHDGLWYKLWDMGVKGRMWRVIKKMYASKSAVLLEGEKSDTFTIDQNITQNYSLYPILFSVFVNDLLKEVQQNGLGIQLTSGKTVGGMLFADHFVGISDSKESLQKLLDVI